jgi:hypothetical protein
LLWLLRALASLSLHTTETENGMLRSWLLWNLQPLGRPLLSLIVAAVVYGLLIPRWIITFAVGAYAALKFLSELSSLLLELPPHLWPQPSVWLGRMISDAHGVLILVMWLPCSLPSLAILCWEILSLVRLRICRPAGRVVVLQQNICFHGFMVMPELVVNAVLTLDRLCGRGNVRLKVDFGERTMEGGMHPYYSASRGPNVWRYYFEDRLTATDEREGTPAAATLGYLLHSVVHHHGATFFFPHEAGASTFALPPSWSGRESDFGSLPYSRQLHAWYGEQRHSFHSVVQRIGLRPTRALQGDVECAWAACGFREGQFVLGVHLRGTDKTHSGGIVYPSAYFPYIDCILRTRGPGCGLFVATDSPRFLEEARARYGERVRCLDCMRDQHNAAWDLERDGYSKGREVLLDTLCLARCDFLLHSTSGVPEFALRLNPTLHDRSVNLSFDGASQLDLHTGERPACGLPDLPVPRLVLLRRFLLAASWWPLFMLKNYSDIPLWLIQRRLLALDMSKAQRDAWSNVEKPPPSSTQSKVDHEEEDEEEDEEDHPSSSTPGARRGGARAGRVAARRAPRAAAAAAAGAQRGARQGGQDQVVMEKSRRPPARAAAGPGAQPQARRRASRSPAPIM